MLVTFFVPGVPGRKGRPRFSRRGPRVVAYTDDATHEFESRVALAGSWSFDTPFSGPIQLAVTAVYPRTSDLSRVLRSGPKHPVLRIDKTSSPDLDNVIKAVTDGLNGVAWLDDKQVSRYGECRKCFACMLMNGDGSWEQEPPGVEVVVTTLEL